MLVLLRNILLCLIVVLATSHATEAPACKSKLTAGNHKEDIYTTNLKWKEPVSSPAGEHVQFECKNGFLAEEIEGNSHKFSCQNGKYNGTYTLPDLLCKSDFHSKTHAKKIPAASLKSGILHCNAQGWAVYEVSRQTAAGDKPLYRVCLDTNTMRPKFAFRLSSPEKTVIRHQQRDDVWGFEGYGKTAEERARLSQGYVKKVQQRRTTQAFPKYSPSNPYPYYFNRGHLTAYTDLADVEDQKTTVEYINAAPQWEVLNENSWSLVEREVRSMLQKEPTHWEVYTGTYGRIQTPKGALFLSPIFDQNGKFLKGQLPVPQVFWKLAYNTHDKNQTRVFLGVNNPEFRTINEIPASYRLCKYPIKHEGKFVQGDEFKGFTYECYLDEFLDKLEAEEKIVIQNRKH